MFSEFPKNLARNPGPKILEKKLASSLGYGILSSVKET